jgi:hypothetical protein
MEKHVAPTVKCKTPTCPTFHLVKYQGLDDGRPVWVVPPGIHDVFDIECQECGNKHR